MIQSDSGIWYPAPLEKRVAEVTLGHKPRAMAVRFKTWICDGDGKIIREGQQGWNTITDYGMDLLATNMQNTCINYLALSSALGPAKKVLSGGITLSIASTVNPASLAVSASANFFAAGDVNNALYIDALGQELKITAYTDPQNVTCSTRPGVWLPGITPTTGPFSTAGVHYTSVNTLATEFQRFNTYDTTALNYNTELSDYTNSRFIHQRIFLSGVAGSSWTINQLGWANAATGNVFGKVNLITPDNVAIGQKYRVQLQLFSGYTPINITGFVANWGATIGSYTLSIRQEAINLDSSYPSLQIPSFTRPCFGGCYAASFQTEYWTGAFSLVGPFFYGDPSFNQCPHTGYTAASASNDVSDAAYTSGTFSKARTWKFSDLFAITGANQILLGSQNGFVPTCLSIKSTSGVITKPSGYWAALTFPIYWTRALVN